MIKIIYFLLFIILIGCKDEEMLYEEVYESPMYICEDNVIIVKDRSNLVSGDILIGSSFYIKLGSEC